MSPMKHGDQVAQEVQTALDVERERQGLSFEEVGQKAGMTGAQAWRYIRQGRPLPISALHHLCEALGLETLEVIRAAEVNAKRAQ